MLWLVTLYLVAAVLANMSIAVFGPTASIVTAFVCIGINITTRDRIHDRWHGSQLAPRMAALIATGGGLTLLFNQSAGRIALASVISFLASEGADAVVYSMLHRRRWTVRSNGSNAVSALVDSLIFPAIAFGGFLPFIVLGQYLAKFGGGALWALVLRRYREPTTSQRAISYE